MKNDEQLNELEARELISFKKIDIDEEDNQDSYADRFSKKSRLMQYWTPHFVPPTSNHVERFFSACKSVYSDLRKSLLPDNLETLLMLKFSREYRDAKMIAKIMAQ